MKIKILLLTTGIIGLLSCKTSQLIHASKPRNQTFKVTILYPNAEGKSFDMDYYENKHMPMVARFLGSNLIKYTIEKGLANGIPNQPLRYMAIGTFYIKSLSEYEAAISPHREAIRADFANYTNTTPVISVSELVK